MDSISPKSLQGPLKIEITTLREEDVRRVDDLGRPNRRTIGFLTEQTIIEYLRRRRILGAATAAGQLVGFLVFADSRDKFRIAQLCVHEDYRGFGIARKLVDALKATATTQKAIKLRCRRDFPAHNMWPNLGFLPLDEKPGRSAQGLPLVLWCLSLSHDDELGLWKAQQTEDELDVVIDAQIFFDFEEEDTPKSLVSKALKNDFLLDVLNLWITDEIFNEIDRQPSQYKRDQSRDRAHGFPRLPYAHALAEDYTKKLQSILPYGTSNEFSDIRHIAKTAASNVRVFVTRDDRLLKCAGSISEITGLTILHPADVVASIHEEAEKHSYTPSRVSGLGLTWQRFRTGDLQKFPSVSLLKKGETKGKLLENLRYYISQPSKYNCERLLANGEPIGIRVIDFTHKKILRVPFARLCHSRKSSLIYEFLVADSLALSAANRTELVSFEIVDSDPEIAPSLTRIGFVENHGIFSKFTLSRIAEPREAMKLIEELAPSIGDHCKALSVPELERFCSPLIADPSTPCFLVPIRPGFAMGLIDRAQSADDLFGGDPSVLLRWENVYYRKKSRHLMLRAPARIFWYVSNAIGAVIGVSLLESVEIDSAKALFRRFQKFGILEWDDVYTICGRNAESEIMALRFSHTFLFNERISLQALRAIFKEKGIAESLQSPATLPFPAAQKIFTMGFPS